MKLQSKSRMLAPALAMAALWGVAGCQDKNKNGVPESPATSGQIEKTLDNAGKTIEKGVEKAVPAIEKGVKDAVPVIEKNVKTGARLTENAATTGKVKAALMADKSVPASTIDVDTKNNTVFLRGRVKSNAQRAQASIIARKNAGGYNIKNELKVVGAAPASVKR